MLYYFVKTYNTMYNCMNITGDNGRLYNYCNQVRGWDSCDCEFGYINILELYYPWICKNELR